MPESEGIYQYGLGVISLGLLAVNAISAVLGYRLGARMADSRESARAHVGVMQGMLFSLLTLLLSFTLSFALNRYEARRDIITQEANAIGTAFLRSLTLPEPYRQLAKTKLRLYLETRDALYDAMPGTPAFNEVLAATDRMHVSLWRDVERLDLQYPEAKSTELYERALNDVIDAHSTRTAAMTVYIPGVVLWMLMILTVACTFALAYSRGLSGSRTIASQVFISLAMIMTVMVILDVDHPRRGLIRVPNTPIESAQALIDTFYRDVPKGQ